MTRSIRRGRTVALAGLLASVLLGSGCSYFSDDAAEPESSPSPTEEAVEQSQFTRDGTFQSHIDVDGIDFVYTLYPTKSTPRTNEWYPRGPKFFSFTFQGYDLDQGLRDPFATKRKIWLDRIKVTSSTVREGGGKSEHPYELDRVAKEITFDPEPLSNRYGMLVTSPKGAFELRNQRIAPTALDTREIILKFTATVWIAESAGSSSYEKQKIKQTVPITIFESDEKTEVADIPIDAN